MTRHSRVTPRPHHNHHNHHNHHKASLAARAPPLVSSGGSAVRRRERRLRSFWRHEQMAVQMALATVTHHSFQVGTAHDALRSQKPVTSAGGMRPPLLVEGRPQVRIQRHTVEQRIEHTPYVQILDALVPQKVEKLVDFFKDLDTHVPVQVIEVPKISQDIIPQRSVDLVPQMVEDSHAHRCADFGADRRHSCSSWSSWSSSRVSPRTGLNSVCG